MAAMTLKALHGYLKLLENTSELKRKMPASLIQKSLKDGLHDIGRVLGVDSAIFKDPKTIASLIGAQRFVVIWGEPSISDHIARIFDSTRVLLTVLIDPEHFGSSTSGQSGPVSGGAQHQAGAYSLSSPSAPSWPSSAMEEQPAGLKLLLSGNTALACKLFRALFEHMLGFAYQPGAQPSTAALLVNELTGSREHSRSFFSTAFFILGAELDRGNLMPFMLEQGLFGVQIFEQMFQNRDYCAAFYDFRRLERAFVDSPNQEESRLRSRMDQFNAQFGGKPCEAKLFEADEQDKARVDAFSAAGDVLETLALTPWCMSLNHAVSTASSNSIRSLKVISRHFEHFAHGVETKQQANQEIADHLLGFAWQFSADTKAA